MNEVIYYQLKTLIIFAFTGAIIGVVFDIFRIRRRAFGTNNIITYVEDILFWIIAGIILTIVTMKYTDGTIRNYMIIGLILGALIYFLTISNFIIRLNTFILRKIFKICKFLVIPFKKINKITKKGWKKKKNML